MKAFGAWCTAVCLVLASTSSAFAAEVNVSQLGENGWYSDDTRADGSGAILPSGTNLISPTLTDAPEGTSGAATAAHDADILSQILLGAPPVAPPPTEHQNAVRLFIDAVGGAGGKSQISHRKDDGAGFGPASLILDPSFFVNYSWFGNGTNTVTASFKLGIKTAEFGATGVSGRTGENAWDKVLIYEPGQGNGNNSDGVTWYQESLTPTNGNWWFFDRTNFQSSQGTPLTLQDMTTSLTSVGSRTIADVMAVITAPGSIITSIQFGIGSNNPGGSVYVNQLETNFYRPGDTLTFGTFPVANVTQGTQFSTIQAAIDAANAGDVIEVAAGTYPENVSVTQSVTLRGANWGVCANDPSDRSLLNGARGPETIIAPASGKGMTIAVGVDDVVIDGFFFSGVTTGVDASNPSDGAFTNLEIVNNRFENLSDWGVFSGGADRIAWQILCNRFDQWTGIDKTAIWMAGGTNQNTVIAENFIRCTPAVVGSRGMIIDGAINVLVENNTVVDLNRYAIQLANGSDTVLIRDNEIANVQVGLQLLTSLTGFDDVTAEGNVISDVTAIGIWLSRTTTGAPPAAALSNLVIQDNVITQDVGVLFGNFGLIDLRVENGAGPNGPISVLNNQVTFTGTLGAATAAHAFKVRGRVGGLTVSGNTFDGGGIVNTGVPASSGIFVETDDSSFGQLPATAVLDLSGNTITGFTNGLSVYATQAGTFGGLQTGTQVAFNQNDLSGVSGLGVQNGPGETVDASCNWWGGLAGPDAVPSNPNPGAPGIEGPASFTPWLDAPDGNCDEYGPNNVAVQDPGASLQTCESCLPVTVVFDRADTTPLRALSVDFQLSPELALCGLQVEPIVASGSGGVFEGYSPGSDFQAFLTDNGGGSYTYDLGAFGPTCGPTTGGALFTIFVTDASGFAADATGSIQITGLSVRDCANAPLPGVPGPGTSIDIDATAPAPITDLVAVQKRSGNAAGSTTVIDVSWTAPADPDHDGVVLYRKGFGDYPEYDDGTGAAPALPATIAAADADGWTPVATLAPGTTTYPDDPGTRDFFTYIVFTTDGCYEAGSALSNGALSYFLGDVAPLPGDNTVNTIDISALGAAYGAVEGDANYNAFVDVGPTTDFSVLARPTTDNRIQFEDFVVFAIDYNSVSRLAPVPAAAVNGVELVHPATLPEVGETMLVEVRASGDGTLQALSTSVEWNRDRLEYDGWFEGDLLRRQGGLAMTLSPEPGTIDAAVFGERQGIAGEGVIGTLRFRVKSDGNPGLRFGAIDGRDGANESVSVNSSVVAGIAGAPPVALRSELRPNVPNPFNPKTTVHFSVGRDGPVSVRIYDVSGRLVRTLVNETMAAGLQAVDWDGTDDAGNAVSSGTYLLRLSTVDTQQSRSMLLVK